MAEYMVLLVDVESGQVVDAFGADKKKIHDDNSDKVTIHGKKTTDINPPFNIDNFTSDRAIGTFCTQSNPT